MSNVAGMSERSPGINEDQSLGCLGGTVQDLVGKGVKCTLVFALLSDFVKQSKDSRGLERNINREI